MKKYFIAMMVMSVSAMACPNLSGTFLCPTDEGDYAESTITQSVENGVTVYQIIDEGSVKTIVADGKERLTDSGTELTECNSDNSLRMHSKGSDGPMSFDVDLNVSIKSNKLNVIGFFKVFENGSLVHQDEMNTICDRK